MFKVLTGALMLLYPILGAAASSDYFYSSVTPPTEDRATEKPLDQTPADCLEPNGVSTYQGERTIAYEVNGASLCGSNAPAQYNWWWKVTYNLGTRVKIRYATRDATPSSYTCLPSTTNTMSLWLSAPAMGIVGGYYDGQFLTSNGGWSNTYTNFRNPPPTNVWNDLYDGVPPVGDYVLIMGCNTAAGRLGGEIRFTVK